MIYAQADEARGIGAEATLGGVLAWMNGLEDIGKLCVIFVCATEDEMVSVANEMRRSLPMDPSRPILVNANEFDPDAEEVEGTPLPETSYSFTERLADEQRYYFAHQTAWREDRIKERGEWDNPDDLETIRRQTRRVQFAGPAAPVREAYVEPGKRAAPRFFRSHVKEAPATQPVSGVHFVGGISAAEPAKAVRRPQRATREEMRLVAKELRSYTVLDTRGVEGGPGMKPEPFYLKVKHIKNYDLFKRVLGDSLGEGYASRDDGSPVCLINPARLPAAVRDLLVWEPSDLRLSSASGHDVQGGEALMCRLGLLFEDDEGNEVEVVHLFYKCTWITTPLLLGRTCIENK